VQESGTDPVSSEKERPLRYERSYWDLVIGDPNFQPSPRGQKVSLRAQMEGLGLTAKEFAKLEEAENNSNQLVQLEHKAFNSMKGLFRGPAAELDVKCKNRGLTPFLFLKMVRSSHGI
jgi:two-component system sensor histidine kinase/response regulator